MGRKIKNCKQNAPRESSRMSETALFGRHFPNLSTHRCIGAYLFQIQDGKQYHIAFLSKPFDDRMSRWDKAQKEGYAIYYAFDKWDHLLRNRFFTLRQITTIFFALKIHTH